MTHHGKSHSLQHDTNALPLEQSLAPWIATTDRTHGYRADQMQQQTEDDVKDIIIDDSPAPVEVDDAPSVHDREYPSLPLLTRNTRQTQRWCYLRAILCSMIWTKR